MTDYVFSPITLKEAGTICRWRYGPGFGHYDLSPADAPSMLAPELLYHAARKDDILMGFACFGANARVYGGPYEGEGLDLGLGMEPGRCGKGEGRAFVEAIAVFARQRFRAHRLRLSVLETNRRAISVYSRAGFQVRRRFAGLCRSGTHTFFLMVRELPSETPRRGG